MKTCVRFVANVILLVLCLPLFNTAFSSSASAQVSVSSTTPNSTTQGTINLNVTVAGKGFKNGAKAQWFVSGTTNPGGVVVNSTAFVNATTLTANITVSDTAVIGNFDVMVANPDGRTGKGTELFAVFAKGTGSSKTCTARNILSPIYMGVGTTSGSLDGSYGGTTAPMSQAIGYDIVEAPDGSLYAAGAWRDPVTLTQNWHIVKAHADGTLDTSFGNNGEELLFGDPNFANFARSIALQPQSDPTQPPLIIVGGDVSNLPTVTRLLPDGSIDATFGSNGLKTFSVPRHSGPSQVIALLIDDSRKIILSYGVPVIARLSADGKTVEWSRSLAASRMAFQTIGTTKRIVTAASSNGNFISYRVMNDSAGTTDTSFGVNGLATVDFCGTDDSAATVAVDSHGNVILGGSMLETYSGPVPNGHYNFAIARLTSTGVLDTTFGDIVNGQHSGKFSADVTGSTDAVESVMVDGFDRIIALGNTYTPDQHGAAFRLTYDGTPDLTFGNASVPSVLAYSTFVFSRTVLRQSTTGSYVIAQGARILP